MVGKVSKAVLGQRRRQKRERGERVIQQQMQLKKKVKVDENPIVINSESDDDSIEFHTESSGSEIQVLDDNLTIDIEQSLHHTNQPTQDPEEPTNNRGQHISNHDNPELADFQEAELEARNQANDLLEYYNLAVENETSDDDSDVTDEEEARDNLWPIFSGDSHHSRKSVEGHQSNSSKAFVGHQLNSSRNPVEGRQLKSGQKSYQQPVPNPDSSSRKLLPAAVPAATQCDRNKRQREALGSNIHMMGSFVIRSKPTKVVAIDPNLESAVLEENVGANHHGEPVNDRLACLLEKRLSTQKDPQLTSHTDKHKKARSKWAELDSSLNVATLRYRKKEKKDKKFKFPQSMMNNIYLYNNLCLEYSLNGTPSPSVTASLSAARAANKQRPMSTGPRKPTSGIYLSRLIIRESRNILKNQQLLEVKRGNQKTHRSLLDKIELRKELFTWSASQVSGHVTPLTFRDFVNNSAFPKFNIQRTICRDTSTRWMLKLGYRPQEYRKGLYFDGHERPDVLEARKKYIEDFDLHRQRSRIYEGDKLDTAPPVSAAALANGKETVFVYHDESTIHAKEKPKSAWLLPGTRELRSKNAGRLIHISDFILETTGRLRLLKEQLQGTTIESNDAATIIYPGSTGDKWWDMEQLCHQVSTKAIPIFEALHPNLQAVFIFDCSSAHGAFSKTALRVQNMNLRPGGKQSRLRDSIIPSDDPLIPEHLRGLPQTFCYDSSHPDPNLAGKPKGIQVILEERGLWQHYTALQLSQRKPVLKLKCNTCVMSNIRKDAVNRSSKLIQAAEETGFFLSQEQCVNELMADKGRSPEDDPHQSVPLDSESTDSKICCWSKITSQQSDFANERPLLQAIIEDAGHICLFLPKFHCELNPIELFWSYIKECEHIIYSEQLNFQFTHNHDALLAYRKQAHTAKTFPSSKILFEEVRQSCPLITIRKYVRRTDRQLSVYREGYSGAESEALMKLYTSHRCVPRRAAMYV
ncbi:hypothetical protein MJO29_002934 [Puccinia striiformis f. sp. tritici]|nr:hypothetical protein MJO29_002934 [Puccinia striiformis f. sp. tritici]